MGTGKSTLAEGLSAQLVGYRSICLDTYRLATARMPGTDIHKEQQAQARCLIDIRQAHRLLYESTGSSLFFREVYRHLIQAGYKVTVLRLRCSLHTMQQRCRQRTQHVPLPWGHDLARSLTHIEQHSMPLAPDIIINTDELGPTEALHQALLELSELIPR